MAIPRSRSDVPIRFYMSAGLHNMGELLSIPTSESSGLEEHDLYSLRLVCVLRIHVIHDQSLLDLALHAKCSTAVLAPYRCSSTTTSPCRLYLELYWPGFGVKDPWENNHGHRWCCLFSRSGSSDFCQTGHELLAAFVSVALYYRHRG